MLKKIPYITLWVEKFDETVKFYRDILGLKAEYQDQNFVRFETEGTKLFFHRIMDKQKQNNEKIELHFETEDVDETSKNLKGRGIKFSHEPKNMPWGSRIASFTDPEGFTVELVGPIKEGEPVEEHPNFPSNS